MRPTDRERRRVLLQCAVLAGGTALLTAPTVRAQDGSPSRPMKFIVPFGPGSSNDITARLYAKVIGEMTGQTVVVENRPGGDGIIGAKALLAEPADGSTVLFASNSILATNAAVRADLPYDPLKDFEPISTLEASYATLAVPAESRFKAFDDFAQFARQNPKALNHGAGTPMYALWNEWLMELVGAKATHIPYKDSGAVVRALGGAEIDYAIVAVNALSSMIGSGRIRALLYTGPTRHPQLPLVPTPAEAGLKDFSARIWTAAAVRAGTPRPVRDRLEALFDRALKTEQVQARLKANGATPIFSGADGMRRFQQAEIVRWKKLIADTGIKFE